MNFESVLLSQMRTGHPLVDALIASALFAMMARLPHLAKMVIKWARAMRTPRRPESSLVLCDMVPHHSAYAYNISFIAVMAKLAKQVELDPFGSLETWRLTNGKTTILPTKLQTREFWHEGVLIRWRCDYTDTDKDDRPKPRDNQSIVLWCEDAGAMVRFVQNAVDEHEKAETKPRLATMVHSKSGDISWKLFSMTPKTFDTVVLNMAMKEVLLGDLRAFIDGCAWYNRMGLDWKRGYLLSGPPGTGKTSIVRAMANLTGMDIYYLNLRDLKTDVELDTAFNTLPLRCILVFEDIDCMSRVTHTRTPAEDHTADKDDDKLKGITLSALLNHLDGMKGAHGRITVMTSNHPEVLDPALIRPGRVDLHVRLSRCTREMLDDLFTMFYGARIDAHPLPADGLTPAQVASAYMSYRDDPVAAHAFLSQNLLL
jgi:hypothetical protein